MAQIPIFWDIVSERILEISSLSNGDYATLCAHLLATLRNEKRSKRNELKARGYSEEQINAALKDHKAESVEFLGLRYTRPLSDFEYYQFSFVMTLHENYERGNLPFPGTISEQPAQIIEIFNTISAILTQHQIAEQKEQERKNKLRK